ncbi:MAG: hypothetical protein R3F14_05270 [Polyangiaceae bacterium]
MAHRTYTLVERAGEGGFGSVWKASLDGVPFALKWAHDADEASVRTLIEEAETTTLALSPRLPELVDVGWLQMPTSVAPGAQVHTLQDPVPGARPFVGFTWLEGTPLDRRPALSGDEAVHEALLLARDIAEALVNLHGVGTAHGDLKPQNVLVDAAGRASLIDLGLACPAFSTAMPGATPRYLAVGDADLGDARARDLLALGLVLAERVSAAVRASQSPLAVARSARLPAPLDELCGALLARNPTARPSARWVIRAARAALRLPDEPFEGRSFTDSGTLRTAYLRLRRHEIAGAAGTHCDTPDWLLQAVRLSARARRLTAALTPDEAPSFDTPPITGPSLDRAVGFADEEDEPTSLEDWELAEDDELSGTQAREGSPEEGQTSSQARAAGAQEDEPASTPERVPTRGGSRAASEMDRRAKRGSGATRVGAPEGSADDDSVVWVGRRGGPVLRPLPVEGLRRWLVLACGAHAAAWPVHLLANVREGLLAARLLELAHWLPLEAWTFRDVEVAADRARDTAMERMLAGLPPPSARWMGHMKPSGATHTGSSGAGDAAQAGLAAAGDAAQTGLAGAGDAAQTGLAGAGDAATAARLALALAAVPPDPVAIGAVEADRGAPAPLVLAAADALRRSGELGRAKSLVLREQALGIPGARALAAEILRRAGELEDARRVAEEAVKDGDDEAGRARAVLARLALDAGSASEAAGLCERQSSAAVSEVAALVAARGGELSTALAELDRGEALARTPEERARLAAARGFVLHATDPEAAYSSYSSAVD